MRTIEVRPHRGGWQVFEAPGVEPFYVGPNTKENAIGYATERLKFSGAEARVVCKMQSNCLAGFVSRRK